MDMRISLRTSSNMDNGYSRIKISYLVPLNFEGEKDENKHTD